MAEKEVVAEALKEALMVTGSLMLTVILMWSCSVIGLYDLYFPELTVTQMVMVPAIIFSLLFGFSVVDNRRKERSVTV